MSNGNEGEAGKVAAPAPAQSQSSQVSMGGLIGMLIWGVSIFAISAHFGSFTSLLDRVRSLADDPGFLPRAIFSAWAVTAMTYGLCLAYFRGLFGFRTMSEIWWDSETVGWLLGIFGALASIGFALLAIPTTPFWVVVLFVIFMIIMVMVYFGLILMLARHDLPQWLFWLTLALFALGVIVAIVVTLALGGVSPPSWAASSLIGTIVAFILGTVFLVWVLAYKLGRALGRSLPKAVVRVLFGWIPGLGIYVPLDKEVGGTAAYADKDTVDNPSGALPDPSGVAGAGQRATIHPGACLVVDFGSRRIADHWNTADLRVIRANTDVPISVQVSNDGQNWESCDHVTGADYDVPWFNSPFRYVRICNLGNGVTGVADVFDLDP